MGILDFASNNNSIFKSLKKSFSEKHESIKKEVIEKHGNTLALLSQYPTQLAAGAVGTLAIATTVLPIPPPANALAVESSSISPVTFVISNLSKALPTEVRPLTADEEENIGEILSRDFGISVTAELDGIRLNRSYGLMGAEQHLARYPGDNMSSHFSSAEDSQKYYSSGMAPGLGAWGYFTRSSYDMTEKDIEREKYYIAVQTFLAPGFHDNVKKYIEFFKYRKMLVVNPENGKAMVVVIGDAGPGESTGKSLGGSPEVMKYLERVDGAQKGPVIYFFIDDPEDTIPLGPIGPK